MTNTYPIIIDYASPALLYSWTHKSLLLAHGV